MTMTDDLRGIGLLDLTASGWAASGSYTRTTLQSLARACSAEGVRLAVLSNREPAALAAPQGVETRTLATPGCLPGER
jgi:hypothetical protein